MAPAVAAGEGRALSLRERFVRFGELEARGSSPLYEHLSTALHDRGDVLDLFDHVDRRQQRPNLLFAAVHDVLLRGLTDELARYYPSVGGSRQPDDRAAGAFVAFVERQREEILELMTSRSTQTNEVRRSALFLPALTVAARREPGPVALVDVGAAAGLNLLIDRLGYRYGDERTVNPGGSVTIECEPRAGVPLPELSGAVAVADRVGIDLHPLDPSDPADARWLRACVWPEHSERRVLLDAALDFARQDPPRLVAGHAVELLPAVIDEMPEDVHVCVMHSAALAYFTPDEREAFGALLEGIGARRRLSWISLEGPFVPPFDVLDAASDSRPPAPMYFVIGLTTFRGGERSDTLLGRGDHHGAWIQWLGEGLDGADR